LFHTLESKALSRLSFSSLSPLLDHFSGSLGCLVNLSRIYDGQGQYVLHAVGVLIAPVFAALLQVDYSYSVGMLERIRYGSSRAASRKPDGRRRCRRHALLHHLIIMRFVHV
jgi:hypothetical protein